MKRICHACFCETDSKCQGCGIIYYCSPPCQAKDHAAHQAICGVWSAVGFDDLRLEYEAMRRGSMYDLSTAHTSAREALALPNASRATMVQICLGELLFWRDRLDELNTIDWKRYYRAVALTQSRYGDHLKYEKEMRALLCEHHIAYLRHHGALLGMNIAALDSFSPDRKLEVLRSNGLFDVEERSALLLKALEQLKALPLTDDLKEAMHPAHFVCERGSFVSLYERLSRSGEDQALCEYLHFLISNFTEEQCQRISNVIMSN